ncbi:MAG: RecQ family ATP-dependent DNA helicase [Bacteroidia bacterium]
MTDIHQILKKYWGYDSFRSMQEEIIRSIEQGKDTLALLPTGGGKSVCFQVPALAQDGLCIVVTPLIALMKDQVENLQALGIRAMAVYSGMSKREVDVALDNCVYGKEKFLYVSPERLQTELFKARAGKMRINLIAVDEAHCISEWGHDFRPGYLRIAELRELFPDVPLLALTASATPRVQEDIMLHLKFKEKHVLKKSFERENLVYGVVHDEDKRSKMQQVLKKIPGTGIIYARTRMGAVKAAEFLQKHGISADYYHAGLSNEERNKKQDAWKKGRTRIIVATTAFGMGIDKADVRLVMHVELPESLEAYYQEAGRCGRDGKRSFAVSLITEDNRLDLQSRVERQYVHPDVVKTVYHALGNYFQLPVGAGLQQSFDFDLKDFSKRFELHPVKVYHALKQLERQDYLTFSEAVFLPSRLRFLVDYKTLYDFELKNLKYDDLIKTILRSYGNPFDTYVNISEKEIAERGGQKASGVIKQLKALSNLGVLDYVPVTDKPQITFVQPRQDRDALSIDKKDIARRKKIQEEKLKAVVDFFYNDRICRGRRLLNYFGEKSEKDCGHCDVCLRKPEDMDEAVLGRQIFQKVVGLCKEKSYTLPELVEELEDEGKTKAVRAIRWLIDNDYITVGDKDQIILSC